MNIKAFQGNELLKLRGFVCICDQGEGMGLGFHLQTNFKK